MGAFGFGGGGIFGGVVPGFNPGNAPPAPPVPGVPFGPGPGTISYRALRLAGYIQTGVTPEPEMVQDALDECNAMFDEWGVNQNLQQFIDDRYFAIPTANSQTENANAFTIGPTGMINTDVFGVALTYRPQRIVRANLVLETNVAQPTRIPIEIINVDDFSSIPVLQVQSQVVIRMYVQTTKDNVTAWMFPYPNTGNQLEFFMWPGFSQFPSQVSLLDGTPALLNAVVYNLAYRLYFLTSKDKGVMARNRLTKLENMAIGTKREFERSNAPSPSMAQDLITETGDGSQGAPFNYLYGGYTQP